MKVLLVVTLVVFFLGCFVRAQNSCNDVTGYDTCIKFFDGLCFRPTATVQVQKTCWENGRKLCKTNYCTGPCEEGWIYNLDSRVCYKVLMNKEVSMNWSKAQRECTALNRFAKLAEIKSRTENDFIKDLLSPRFNAFWIGLRDVNQEGHWVWTDGTAVTFSDWHRNEPNNAGNEDCALFHRNSVWWGSAGYKWNDAPCWYAGNYGAVCQMPAQ